MSPTELTLRHLRQQGYSAGVVECWIPRVKRRRDLFGVIDVVACGPSGILMVQTTTRGHIATRAKKIIESEHIRNILASGVEVVVHGWDKHAHRWRLEERYIRTDML